MGVAPSTPRACGSCAGGKPRSGFEVLVPSRSTTPADSAAPHGPWCFGSSTSTRSAISRGRSGRQLPSATLKNELVDVEAYRGGSIRGSGTSTHREAAAGRVLLAILPAAPAAGQRAGLRRPDHDDGAPAAGVPGDAAEHYRRRFRHVLVDEYQDTNHAQYMLIRELVGHGGASQPGRSEPTLGEPGRARASSGTPTSRSTPSAARRSATSWSSSRDYPRARTILLEQNYRSTQTILSRRKRGDLPQREAAAARRTSGPMPGTGVEKVVGYVADERARRGGSSWSKRDRPALHDTAGVARPSRRRDLLSDQRSASRAFEEVLVRVGQPYKGRRWGRASTNASEIKDALAYLRVREQSGPTPSTLRRIINVPKRRGIGERTESVRRLSWLIREQHPASPRRSVRRGEMPPSIATARRSRPSASFTDLIDGVACVWSDAESRRRGRGPARGHDPRAETGYLTRAGGVQHRPAGRDAHAENLRRVRRGRP